jgi:hypothetical protein
LAAAAASFLEKAGIRGVSLKTFCRSSLCRGSNHAISAHVQHAQTTTTRRWPLADRQGAHTAERPHAAPYDGSSAPHRGRVGHPQHGSPPAQRHAGSAHRHAISLPPPPACELTTPPVVPVRQATGQVLDGTARSIIYARTHTHYTSIYIILSLYYCTIGGMYNMDRPRGYCFEGFL